MNSAIIFCNCCGNMKSETGETLAYYLTTCGKVLCEDCTQTTQSKCNKCQRCSRLLISAKMGKGVDFLFKDLHSLNKQLQNAASFQESRYKLLVKNLLQDKATFGQTYQQANLLAKQKAALEVQVNKLQESNYYLQQKLQQQVPQRKSPYKTDGRLANVLGDISKRINESHHSDSTIYGKVNVSGGSGYHRGGLPMPPFHSFSSRAKSAISYPSRVSRTSRKQSNAGYDYGVIHQQPAYSVISRASHKSKYNSNTKY